MDACLDAAVPAALYAMLWTVSASVLHRWNCDDCFFDIQSTLN